MISLETVSGYQHNSNLFSFSELLPNNDCRAGETPVITVDEAADHLQMLHCSSGEQ